MARVPVDCACMLGSDSWVVPMNRACMHRGDSVMARVPVNGACMHGSDSWLVPLNPARMRRSDSCPLKYL